MNYLIDTHVLLWFVDDSPTLSDKARIIIESNQNTIYLHKVSLWEIAIKSNIGKLILTKSIQDLFQEAQRLQFKILDISPLAVEHIQMLPLYHRDPFDRLLIAEALVHELNIVSADLKLDAYPVVRVW
jgi:PIN domain nuclease of toxin-antitoxin system